MVNQHIEDNFARRHIQAIYQQYEEFAKQKEADPDNKANRIENPFEELESIFNVFFENDEFCN